ncbi:MAG: signal peptidase II [Bauldia sp.]|nr:signal peptidase II [Bauldia sp.]
MASWRASKPAGPLSAFGLGTVAAVVVVDQAAKLIAEARLPLGEAIDILPILTLYRVYNTGIAFSMFADSGLALVVMTLAISAVVIALWTRNHDGGPIAAAGFALIVGGAVGNLIDRLRFGYVIDFLLLHIGDRTLFVFNLADAALTLGPALLLVVYLWPAKAR